MDWQGIVSRVTHEQPALVVDSAGRVRFVNAPMEEVLGWPGAEMLERDWLDMCVSPRDRSVVAQLVADGMSGAAHAGELPVVTRDGRRLAMRVDLSCKTAGRTRGLLVVGQGVRPHVDSPVSMGDWSCDVSLSLETRGIVQAIRFLDPSRDGSRYVGQPLRALLTDLGCASVEDAAREILEPPSNEFVQVTLPRSHVAFCVVTAQVCGVAQVRVTVRRLPVGILTEIVEAKVHAVADQSRLSDRERQVLELLLRGRGLDDIAAALHIATRTVKFHQANVLQKVGAQSRLDLLRVVL